ncbi:MAG: prepilin-type N-terminal cleavage/methylation domain-containing protein [SAR324 cluster bacterium]|uniref:Prepilin-type N-terminal cleavage/methylation domain-containing protein n=1 Tax=SAR324 cluster bacterium TaxID=2024889 RepID=A0A7X9IKU3_9DELT|nr:prepilin-type N-terminal cleavage/methylation domain-containing protein [SAR324 cluster bacterium]
MRLIRPLFNFVRSHLICGSIRKEHGFTVIEMLVTSVLMLIISALTASTILFIKQAYKQDSARKQSNQSLRGTLDILGSDLRVAGQNLPIAFPAFELIDGGEGPDELVVRRNLLDEVLKVCEKIQANTSEPHISFSKDLTTAGCVFSDNTHNYDAWRTYRLSHGGSCRAYVLNMASGLGEFFTYTGEDLTGYKYRIWTDKTKWKNTYNINDSAVYLLEEWRYRIRNGVLEVISGEDENTAFNVMLDAKDFQVTVHMNDDSILESFDSDNNWGDVLFLEVEITTTQQISGQNKLRSLKSRFFPRNALSF